MKKTICLLLSTLLLLCSCGSNTVPETTTPKLGWSEIMIDRKEKYNEEVRESNKRLNESLANLVPLTIPDDFMPEVGPKAEYKIESNTVISNNSMFWVVKNDNTLWGWGQNGNQLFLQNSVMPLDEPVQVLTDVESISGHYTLAAIRTDGTLWMWGYNERGQIGNGQFNDDTDNQQILPVKIMDNIKSASPNSGYSNAITKDNELYGWGRNVFGELALGAGYKTDTRSAYNGYGEGYDVAREKYTVTSSEKVADNVIYMVPNTIANNFYITEEGYLYGSGYEADGFLADSGEGSTKYVQGEALQILPDKIISMDVSRTGVVAVSDTNELYTWGPYLDEIDDGNKKNYIRNYMSDVKQAAIGERCAYAIKTDGTLWSWGQSHAVTYNTNGYMDPYSGDLGTGFYYDLEHPPVGLTPKKVMDDVEKVFACGTIAFAIKTDGTLWGWGDNIHDTLGIDNGSTIVYAPLYITDNAHSIYTDNISTLLLKNDGTLWQAGEAFYRNGYEDAFYFTEFTYVTDNVKIPDEPLPLQIQ